MLIFPEAHRSHSGELGHFERGAFHLSAHLNEKITPLFLKANQPFLTSKSIFDSIKEKFLLEIIPLPHLQPPSSSSRTEVQNYAKQSRELFLKNSRPIIINYENSLMKIKSSFFVTTHHPHFQGHFNHFPVFPAVSQIQLVKKILAQSLKKESLEIIHIEK